VLAVGVALACAACTSGPSPSPSPRPQPSTASPVTHPLLTKLQQTELRFAHRGGANPNAVTAFASSRNLQPGQQGVVLAVRWAGTLVGSCSSGHPAVEFRLTSRSAGPPVVTEVVREPLARPVGLHLLAPYWPPAPSPAGGEQQFAFFQIVGGGEAADFSLAVWATLTPVAEGCAFSANGVLRVRCSGLPPSVADPICSYVSGKGAHGRT
jgi:hypothetical protein